MSRSKTTSVSADRYHHGDLRQALLNAARELAAEVGVDAFSLREVARRAGVSHGAPYHHFADKTALVRALALRAFEDMQRDLLAATTQHTDALAQIQALSLAYVQFALRHPAEFRFMFSRELCLKPDEPGPDQIKRAGENAYAILKQALQYGQSQGLIQSAPLENLAFTLWCALHGLSTLLIDSPVGVNLPFEYALNQAHGVISTLLGGLQT